MRSCEVVLETPSNRRTLFDQLKFNVDSMDVFFWFGIIFPLVIVGIHYVLVRTEALWCRRKISGAGQLSS